MQQNSLTVLKGATIALSYDGTASFDSVFAADKSIVSDNPMYFSQYSGLLPQIYKMQYNFGSGQASVKWQDYQDFRNVDASRLWDKY